MSGGVLAGWGLERLVSGGQSGVDRAALDAAMAAGVEVGGWCPAGRDAEDGAIDRRYPLRETPSADTAERTEWNVRDSDATLILNRGTLDGGTALTRELAAAYGRPVLVVAVDASAAVRRVRRWLAEERPRVLNVAGPSEGKRPGIYGQAYAMMEALLTVEQDRETAR